MRTTFKPSDLFRKFQKTVFSRSFELVTDTTITPTEGLTLSYKTDEADVRKYYCGAVEECFDKDDIWSVETLMFDVEDGNCAVIVVEEDGHTLGGVVVQHYWNTGKKVMLLSWLAVTAAHRSRNIGTLLVDETLSYARKNGASVLLGMVENPEISVGDSLAHGDPYRRVKFYSRFDCQRLEVPCYIPAFEEDQEPIVGTMLTLFPLSGEQVTATELSLPELSDFVADLVGYETNAESIEFIETCKKVVSLTPFRTILEGIKE